MRFYAVTLVGLLLAFSASACELCAIYSAASARGESSSGFIFTLSEQYVSASNLQIDGEPFPPFPFLHAAFNDSSYTHFVPSYNFSSRFGVSLNLPYIHREFRRTEILPYPIPGTTINTIDERGSVSGLGDMALVGRWTPFQKIEMSYSAIINILAGVKFPTGDTERLEDEVAQEKYYLARSMNPIHAHAVGGVHQHDLTLGSGSYDGLFGVTANVRWRRLFFNTQAQYYLRTEALDYEMGDLTIVSGGPGVYALLLDNCTLSIQANAFYENQNSDEALGQVNNQTGFTSWYMGPLIGFTWGEHFSANVGADLPLRIYNRGVQTVPDYRVHAGLSWRF